MIENVLVYALMLVVSILVGFLLFMGYQRRKQEIEIEKNDRLTEINRDKLLRLMDLILFYLPGEDMVHHYKEENMTPELQNMINEYLKLILCIYDICGEYCYQSHFTEEELNRHFKKYILTLKEEDDFNQLIEQCPTNYKGIEYLIKICS